MPSIVSEVSAIFVDITHFLPGIPFLFGGGGRSKIFYCCYAGNELYNGITLIVPTLSPN
jgi:hypothetical protein